MARGSSPQMSASSSGGASSRLRRSDRVEAGDDGAADGVLNPLGERARVGIGAGRRLREGEGARDREERGRPPSAPAICDGRLERGVGLHGEHGEVDAADGVARWSRPRRRPPISAAVAGPGLRRASRSRPRRPRRPRRAAPQAPAEAARCRRGSRPSRGGRPSRHRARRPRGGGVLRRRLISVCVTTARTPSGSSAGASPHRSRAHRSARDNTRRRCAGSRSARQPREHPVDGALHRATADDRADRDTRHPSSARVQSESHRPRESARSRHRGCWARGRASRPLRSLQGLPARAGRGPPV